MRSPTDSYRGTRLAIFRSSSSLREIFLIPWYLEMERNLMTVSSLSFFFSFSFLFLASKFCRNWQVFTFRRPFFKIADPCKRILVGLTFRRVSITKFLEYFQKQLANFFYPSSYPSRDRNFFIFLSRLRARYVSTLRQISLPVVVPSSFSPIERTRLPLSWTKFNLFSIPLCSPFFFRIRLTRISINRPRDKKRNRIVLRCDEQKFFSKQFIEAVQNFSKIFDQSLIEF